MFLFRLALALGMTVEDLSIKMSSSEMSEWAAYYRIEPFGDVRNDVHAAMICQSVISPHMEKGKKPPSIEELMPFRDTEKEGQTADEMKQMCKNFASAFGGKKRE